MIISYAITVCDEHKELDRLLSFLIKNVREGDEIVVQCDEENTTPEVLKVLNKYADRVKVVEFQLNGHFADFKNNLTKECSGDYIFQIDADEVPNEYLIKNLGIMLEMNPEVDVYRVPRINTVEGLTQDHINRWGWNVNEKGWVNFSDHQWRIYRNDGKIKWINKVHEVLTGFEVMSQFPPEEEYCLYHPKTIEKQEKQNIHYDEIEMQTIKGEERDKNYYNEVFSKAPIYHSDFDKMKAHGQNWAKIWRSSVPLLKEHNIKSILDIGSGMGQFGQLVQSLDIKYKGIDFSEYAINYSKENIKGREIYECVDAFKYPFEDEVDCYVSHEFLEHIEGDTEILSKLKPNKLIIFSVPSFDDKGHVRMFKNESMIINRYSPYIKDLKVTRITPAIHFLGWGITK